MSTKRKTTNKYQRYTCPQLVAFIKKWQKKHASLAKTPAWKTTNGWTPAQQRAYIMGELKGAAKALRFVTLCAVDDKLKALKKDVAKQLGVTYKSSKVTSPVLKRLKTLRSQISKCATVPSIVNKCSTVKVASFKTSKVGTSKSRVTTRTTTRSVRRPSSVRTSTVASKATTAKYKKQTKVLKKEIQKLKQRNTFMKTLVAKFRKEVSQMQRHYGTLSTQAPRWKVISGKKVNQDVSNIVKFSNALNNVMLKQRKAG